MKNLTLILVLAVSVMATGCGPERKTETQKQEQAQTEAQQKIHLTTSPPPRLQSSQERKNLIERLKRFNTDDKVSYIYLVNYGKVMAFYTVKGKVSSVNSLLTTPEQIVNGWSGRGGGHHYSEVVASPDLDGSYGSNGDAIFFFTTDNTYVEWAGDYMLCDKPLKLSTPPAMVINVEDK